MRYIDRVKEPEFQGQVIEPNEEVLLLKYNDKNLNYIKTPSILVIASHLEELISKPTSLIISIPFILIKGLGSE